MLMYVGPSCFLEAGSLKAELKNVGGVSCSPQSESSAPEHSGSMSLNHCNKPEIPGESLLTPSSTFEAEDQEHPFPLVVVIELLPTQLKLRPQQMSLQTLNYYSGSCLEFIRT